MISRLFLSFQWLFLLTVFPPFTFGSTENTKNTNSPETRPISAAESQPASLPPPPDIKLVINIPSMKLTVYQDGKIVKKYSVSVGQPRYPTPTGSYQIQRIEWNPWWYPPDAEWAKDAVKTPPGPRNPLGPVKLVMDGDLRIHGTNKDGSVGRPASHGCFRMHNAEAKELAWFIQTRFSQKTDEKLLDKYKKYSGNTYVVPLDYPVSLELIYVPVEITAEKIDIHPDPYWRVKKLKDKILEVADGAGLDKNVFDPEKLSKLKKPARETLTIPLVDLIQTFNPSSFEPASPPSVSSQDVQKQ